MSSRTRLFIVVSILVVGGAIVSAGVYWELRPKSVTLLTDVRGQVLIQAGWSGEKISPECIYRAEGKVTAIKGCRTGEWTFWWDNGSVREKGSYAKHQLVGYYARSGIWKQWDRKGNLTGDCEFIPAAVQRPELGNRWDVVREPVEGFWGNYENDGTLVSIDIFERQPPNVMSRNRPVKTLRNQNYSDVNELLDTLHSTLQGLESVKDVQEDEE